MSKLNNNCGSRSVSSASCSSVLSDLDDTILNGGEEDSIVSRCGRPVSSTRSQRAKRIRFYHNGNKYFSGVVIPVATERYRSFESLINDLTNILMKYVTLPCGVRAIYSTNGEKVSSLEDLEDGKDYICCGQGETFKRIEYNNGSRKDLGRVKRLSNTRFSSNTNSNLVPKIVAPDCVRPRIITIIRNGLKPRKVIRLLLNKRNASSMDQTLSALTEASQLDSGAVRKVFTLSGKMVSRLEQFFEEEDIFFVYGNERYSQDNFELDSEESKIIQKLNKTANYKNGIGRKPGLPKKQLNRTYDSEDNPFLQSNKDVNSELPLSIKDKYSVGRIIGDGNFAVVRQCFNKETNKIYALKIIDKSKCRGKEDMIDNEVKIMKKLNHPNIMSLISDEDTKTMLYLICEFVDGGDLFDAITEQQKFSEDQAALMIQHLASALAYLHNLNIVHRDVKPENLLVRKEKGKIELLKLGDFGLACQVTGLLYTVCGTPTYVAPEILAETGYGLKVSHRI
ncbi:serine/threonine-protein kinase GL21140 [Agrilus planipennis]|uniref:non-specific serine/threonine protein kinase n=1 Tax=Agrilus planipennis TaxID=224129 RepID=A0A1W4XRF5_AGRPL|nr:serine/threonine-protein kinase GL21140 [Agrilus planipennis]